MTESKGLARLSVVVIALTALACDGYIGVQGRVYEQTETGQSAQGAILIDSIDQVPPSNLKAVPGCIVLIEPWSPKDRAGRERTDLWTATAVSDEAGFFKGGTTSKPGWYDATITVTCAGFAPIEKVFRHERLKHNAVVVLGPRSAK